MTAPMPQMLQTPAALCCRRPAGREDMQLVGLSLNGSPLGSDQYELLPRSLTIVAAALPEGPFQLEVCMRSRRAVLCHACCRATYHAALGWACNEGTGRKGCCSGSLAAP